MNFTMQNYEKLINDFITDFRNALTEKAKQNIRNSEFDAIFGEDDKYQLNAEDEVTLEIPDDYLDGLERMRVKYSLSNDGVSAIISGVLDNVNKSIYRIAEIRRKYDPYDSVRGDGKYPELDAFLDVLEEKQKNHVSPQNVNVERYGQFRACLQELTRIVKETSPDAVIEYTLNTEIDIGNAAIRIEADEFVVYDIQNFIENIQYATNFEIYPLENGNIKIGILFHGMMS